MAQTALPHYQHRTTHKEAFSVLFRYSREFSRCGLRSTDIRLYHGMAVHIGAKCVDGAIEAAIQLQ